MCLSTGAAFSQARPQDNKGLEDFFVGRFTGEGKFRNSIDGVTRSVKLQLTASRVDKNLTLREELEFSDGEKKLHIWKIMTQANGKYMGTRSDVDGVADIVTNSNGFRMQYTANTPDKKGKVYALKFDETFRLIDAKTIENTTSISYLLLHVGDGDMVIKKTGN